MPTCKKLMSTIVNSMANFWEEKSLQELSQQEWESLCDGCAKCCLHKVQDEDTEEVYYTNVACKQLTEACRCSDYANRASLVPDCIVLSKDKLEVLEWMPDTCAYRLVYQKQPLPDWHPLVSADKQSVHSTQQSIQGRFISEAYIHPDELEEHIIRWVE